jgi:hypothetical protein
MFYDKSEPVFPNWWDAIDGSCEPGDPEKDESEAPGGSGEDHQPDASRYHYPVGEKEADATDATDATDEPDRVAEASLGEDGATRYHAGRVNDRITEASRHYEREIVWRVWDYAEEVPGIDSDLWRRDEFGNWIHRLDYGRRESEFGWEIFDPGVGRHLQGVYTMRPMQWESFVRQHEALV